MLLVTSPRRTVSTPVSPLASSERNSSGTLEVSISPLMLRSSASPPSGSRSAMSLLLALQERPHPVDGHGEEDGGVLLRGDLGERLEVAQVQGHRLGLQGVGGLGELLAGLELARGVDDLGPLLPLRPALLAHRPLHLGGHLACFHRHLAHVYPP